MKKKCHQNEDVSLENSSTEANIPIEGPATISGATPQQDTSVTITVSVNCGEGPFILSKTNGTIERFVNIANTGSCTIRLFSTDKDNNEISGSDVTIPPGTRLASYFASQNANKILVTCVSGGNPCEFAFTTSL